MANDTPDTSICTPYAEGPDQCCVCYGTNLGPTIHPEDGLTSAPIRFVRDTPHGLICDRCNVKYPNDELLGQYFEDLNLAAIQEDEDNLVVLCPYCGEKKKISEKHPANMRHADPTEWYTLECGHKVF